MPQLNNPRHERFAALLAGGQLSQVDAYEQAGFKRSTANATKLAKRNSVLQRTQELRDEAARRNRVDMDTHLSNLEAMRQQALEAGNFAAAINAEVAKGKVVGLYVDRFRDETPRSEEEIDRELDKLRRQEAALGLDSDKVPTQH